MAWYTASMLTTSTTTTQYGTMATFKSGAAQEPMIKRIEVFTLYNNTTAGGIGLAINTAATAATITNGGTPQAHERFKAAIAAGSTTIVSSTGAMATNGGAATVFKRFYHAGVGGAGIVWGESELGPLSLLLSSTAAGSELCFVNLVAATPAIYGINITFSE